MEAITKDNTSFDIFSSSFSNIEIADDNKRAIVLLPLMHVGPNAKGLYWTAKMLKKLGPKFRSVPYRYDLEGSEGSSHTLNKLSSPHFDVGWTYQSEEGSWYDPKTKTLWTKGEVTHPDVIAKLARVTTDGMREVNYGSMGVIVETAICSICGSDMSNSNTCENSHSRMEKYEGKTCYKVPTEVSKTLHVALTNDPADGEAEIKNVLIQELGGRMDNFQNKDKEKENNFQTKGTDETKDNDSNATPEENRNQAGDQANKPQLQNQIPGGLAPSSPQTEQPGMAPSPETILRDLAERIKTIETKVSGQAMQEGTPELVNSAPQDQMTQDNMGTTSQFDDTQNPTEENTMDVKDAQANNDQASVNPGKPEMQDVMGGDPMQQIMGMLQTILQRMGGAETQDMGKESLTAGKGMIKPAQADIPTEHQGEGAVGNSEDSGNAKNKQNMMKPGSVATADNSGNTESLKQEVADLTNQMKQMRANLEIQDSSNVPEFGSNNSNGQATEVADMGAKGRNEKFGEYGAWDSIFNGAESAAKFKR